MRRLLKIISLLAAIQVFTAISAFGFHLDPSLNPEPPFVVCKDQRYALCAEASCFMTELRIASAISSAATVSVYSSATRAPPASKMSAT